MKDAKGHGSDARGGDAAKEAVRQIGGIGRAKIANIINNSSGEAHVARIAQAHGIQGGPYKVQGLDASPNRAGQPWATQKQYTRRAVAERIAQHMRTDNAADLVRVKVR